MKEYIAPIENLVDELASLPSIGRKTAQKIAFYIINQENEKVNKFVKSILDAKSIVKYCALCGNFTDSNPCMICKDESRDKSKICVVESAQDIMVIEKTKQYRGLYHVLHGCISPMNGISAEDIKIKELLSRLHNVEEIIIATNPTLEGEATAMYIDRLLKPFELLVTRIAHGVPTGADIEYADEITLGKAIEYRVKMG